MEFFKAATTLRLNELPHLAFGRGAEKTIRYFPDKLPIGVVGDGRTYVFVYLVNRPTPVDFRAFLHRHGELLRALPQWELRLLVHRHLVKVASRDQDESRYEGAASHVYTDRRFGFSVTESQRRRWLGSSALR